MTNLSLVQPDQERQGELEQGSGNSDGFNITQADADKLRAAGMLSIDEEGQVHVHSPQEVDTSFTELEAHYILDHDPEIDVVMAISQDESGQYRISIPKGANRREGERVEGETQAEFDQREQEARLIQEYENLLNGMSRDGETEATAADAATAQNKLATIADRVDSSRDKSFELPLVGGVKASFIIDRDPTGTAPAASVASLDSIDLDGGSGGPGGAGVAAATPEEQADMWRRRANERDAYGDYQGQSNENEFDQVRHDGRVDLERAAAATDVSTEDTHRVANETAQRQMEGIEDTNEVLRGEHEKREKVGTWTGAVDDILGLGGKAADVYGSWGGDVPGTGNGGYGGGLGPVTQGAQTPNYIPNPTADVAGFESIFGGAGSTTSRDIEILTGGGIAGGGSGGLFGGGGGVFGGPAGGGGGGVFGGGGGSYQGSYGAYAGVGGTHAVARQRSLNKGAGQGLSFVIGEIEGHNANIDPNAAQKVANYQAQGVIPPGYAEAQVARKMAGQKANWNEIAQATGGAVTNPADMKFLLDGKEAREDAIQTAYKELTGVSASGGLQGTKEAQDYLVAAHSRGETINGVPIPQFLHAQTGGNMYKAGSYSDQQIGGYLQACGL